jgi:hypothetical protein
MVTAYRHERTEDTISHCYLACLSRVRNAVSARVLAAIAKQRPPVVDVG